MSRILGPTQLKVLEFVKMHGGCTCRDVGRNIVHGDVKKALRSLKRYGILTTDTVRSKDCGKIVQRYYYEDE